MGGSNKLIKLHRRYSKPDYHDQWQARTRIYSSGEQGRANIDSSGPSATLFSLLKFLPSILSPLPKKQERERALAVTATAAD